MAGTIGLPVGADVGDEVGECVGLGVGLQKSSRRQPLFSPGPRL